jgi:arabinogalactan oligomer / maltooligosaccharide transport system permease protein
VKLATLVACLCLAAPARAEELVLWHSYRAGEAAALEATVSVYRDNHPELEIRVLAVPAGPYSQKLKNAIPAGNGPDLFINAHDELGDYRARGLIEPVALESGRFLPETVAPLVHEGGAGWGVPVAFKTLALFYRKDLVATPPKTTDELIAIGKRLTDANTFGLAYELGEPYYHAPWLFGFGGALLGADGTSTALSTDAVAASGEFVRQLALEHRIVPTEINGSLVTELFNRGKAGMVISGPWLVAEIAAGVPFGLAPLPTVSATGRQAQPFLTVEALFIARGRGRPSVLAFADFLTSDAAALTRATVGHQPVANRATYADPRIAADPVLTAFAEQVRASVPMPTAPLMNLVWEPCAEALRQIVRGTASPARAFAAAETRIGVLSRGLPPSVSPAPYLAAMAALLLAGVAWLLVRARRDRIWPEMVRERVAYGFIAPAVIGMAVMVGVPFFAGLAVSVFAFGPGELRFVGFAHFWDIISSRDYGPTDPLSFYYTLVVTVLWTVANVSLHIGIGFALAMLLTPDWLRGRGVFRVLLILPWAVPSYITALVFKGLFNRQLGAINAILAALGVEPVGWFDSFWPAFSANLVTNVWLGFPFMMVTVLGALQAIPPDLYEAARVDGASALRRFFTITLPLVGPALVPAVVLGTIWTFNMFNVVFLVSEGHPEGATDILVTEAYRWAFVRNGRYGYAAAYSVVIFAILLAYSAFTRRLINRLQASPS